jgi:hypothetical protein
MLLPFDYHLLYGSERLYVFSGCLSWQSSKDASSCISFAFLLVGDLWHRAFVTPAFRLGFRQLKDFSLILRALN